MKRIICFHLFNDYSGSPKVLKMVLEGLLKQGYTIDLMSSKGGTLDELTHYMNLNFHTYSYKFSSNKIVTMIHYCWIQLYTFLFAFRWLFCKDVVFYINTLLPVGAALAGKLMGKKIIYHYHENAFIKGEFYKGLALMMQWIADEIICVSVYQASFLNRKNNTKVIPNALPISFVDKLYVSPKEAFERKRVLMLGSLKLYKSPIEFIQLAQKLPQFLFELIINDTQKNIDNFLKEKQINVSDNLKIYSQQADVTTFYNRASLVLNLSNKKKFLETFGLTALEAMSTGLPVIVPTEGGIAEMVEDGVNGYKIDVDCLSDIETKIKLVLSDSELYNQLSHHALITAKRYSCDKMISSIEAVLKSSANG